MERLRRYYVYHVMKRKCQLMSFFYYSRLDGVNTGGRFGNNRTKISVRLKQGLTQHAFGVGLH